MIGAAHTKSRTIQRAVGHPLKRKSDGDLPLERRKQPAPVPVADVQYDNVAHWPEFCVKKNKCRFCKTGTRHVYCTKLSIFSNIYAFGQMILLHNDYFDDNTYIGFYF